jgi:hypothetical protein
MDTDEHGWEEKNWQETPQTASVSVRYLCASVAKPLFRDRRILGHLCLIIAVWR